MKFIIKCLCSAVALILVAYFIPGVSFDSFTTVLITALILGVINAVIRPLIMLLTIPINILTLGLFTFIINAFMLWIVHLLVSGFHILNFTTAIWAAIIYWLANWLINLLFKDDSDKK